MGVKVSARIIIVFAAVISTAISLVAGVMLYKKSLNALYDTVEEVSLATTQSAVYRFSGSFEDVVRDVDSMGGVLAGSEVLRGMSPNETVALFRSIFFHILKTRKDGFALAMRMMQKYDPSAPLSATNYPPWSSPDGLTGLNVWTTYDIWNYLEYYPGANDTGGGPIYDPSTGTHKMLIYTLDPSTGDINSTVLSTMDMSTMTLTAQLPNASRGFWTKPIVGIKAKMPYIYSGFHKSAAGFPDKEVVVTGYVNFEHWIDTLNGLATSGASLVLLDPVVGKLFAHTFYDFFPMTLNCTGSCDGCALTYETGCLLNITTLGPTVTTAVQKTLEAKRGDFFTSHLPGTSRYVHSQFGVYYAPDDVAKQHPLFEVDRMDLISLDSGEYFIRMTHVYKFGENDINLLWFRPTDSVQSKVYGALVQLIIFCVVIFVFDGVMAVMEMLYIARPIGTLSKSLVHLQRYDLELASRTCLPTSS